MTIGLIVTSFLLGLRHGFDWDHIAAISDLTGSAGERRRGMLLSLIYALGHGAVVLVLGGIAILAGAAIPESLDEWMGRVVGATLVLLGFSVLVSLVRDGQNFRLRSRWMLIIDGTFAGVRRVRNRNGTRRIGVDHEHAHEHSEGEHDQVPAHDHAHQEAPARQLAPSGGVPAGPVRPSENRHSHSHHHDLVLPSSLSGRYGIGTATGIGMLHGVGVESPTQIAIFVSSTSVVGRDAGLALLVAWIVGLIVANGVLAGVAGFGLLRAERSTVIYRLMAVVVAAASIALGAMYLGLLPQLIG